MTIPDLQKQSRLAGVFGALALCCTPSWADTILQDTFTGFYQVQFFEPIGQSFTAQDPNIDFAFFFSPINTFLAPAPLTVSLLDGSGFGGALLGSTTLNLGDGFSGYAPADFSGITLTPGNLYTAEVASSNAYWGIEGSVFDVYGGGSGFLQGTAGGCCDVFLGDSRFRVDPVPEPASMALISIFLTGIVLLHRRRLARARRAL